MRELLLLCVADPEFDPTGWYQSEKLDGFRAYWDGATLFARDRATGKPGRAFAPPAEWLAELARVAKGVELDGELWMGRGMYQATKAALQRKVARVEEWDRIVFCAFDAPDVPDDFDGRLARVRQRLAGCRVARAIPHGVVRSRGHADQTYHEVLAQGGEGIVYRRVDAPYEGGRSKYALKRKPAGRA